MLSPWVFERDLTLKGNNSIPYDAVFAFRSLQCFFLTSLAILFVFPNSHKTMGLYCSKIFTSVINIRRFFTWVFKPLLRSRNDSNEET